MHRQGAEAHTLDFGGKECGWAERDGELQDGGVNSWGWLPSPRFAPVFFTQLNLQGGGGGGGGEGEDGGGGRGFTWQFEKQRDLRAGFKAVIFQSVTITHLEMA